LAQFAIEGRKEMTRIHGSQVAAHALTHVIPSTMKAVSLRRKADPRAPMNIEERPFLSLFQNKFLCCSETKLTKEVLHI
jgi:hypothetical protein